MSRLENSAAALVFGAALALAGPLTWSLPLVSLPLVSLPLVLASGAASAEEPAAAGPVANISDADHTAITGAIADQFAAFQRDDGSAAFAHASPGLQAQFQRSERFMEMVRTGYPPVYRPGHIEYADVFTDAAGRPTQRVMITDGSGAVWEAQYHMLKLPDGTWAIDGCELVKAPDLAI